MIRKVVIDGDLTSSTSDQTSHKTSARTWHMALKTLLGVIMASAILSGLWTLRSVHAWDQERPPAVFQNALSNCLLILIVQVIFGSACWAIVTIGRNSTWHRVIGPLVSSSAGAALAFAINQAGFGAIPESWLLAMSYFAISLVCLCLAMFSRTWIATAATCVAIAFMIGCTIPRW